MMRRKIPLILALAALLLASIAWAAERTGSFERTFEPDRDDLRRLEVETSSGEIRIVASDDERLHVRGEVTVEALLPGEADRILARVLEDPPIRGMGELRIGDLSRYGVSFSVFRSLVVDFEIAVPEDLELDLRATSSSGAITIERALGAVEASTSSGDLELTDITGPATVRSSSGDLTLNGVTGPLEVSTSSGAVVLENLGDDLGLTTSSGAVEIRSALAPEASWRLDSSSGDLVLHLPQDARFELEIRTSSGRIQLGGFPLDGRQERNLVSGRIGGESDATLVIHTSSGDVGFRRLER